MELMEGSHHAWLLRSGSPEECVVLPTSADMVQVCSSSDSLGINEVRTLIEQAYQRPSSGSRQQIVVRTQFITHEAQNALLKVLEEPPLSTEFLFVLPHDFVLLPTLLSRLQMHTAAAVATDETEGETFTDFLSQTYAERIKIIEERLKRQDIAWQRAMKRGLITQLGRGPAASRPAAVEYVARTLLTRGASNKMLLEQLALNLPVSSQR